MKILIIDDEIDLCLLLKSYLVKKGNEVSISNTLSEGLEAISEVNPDILFLDNNLPDGLGWPEASNIVLRNPGIKLFLISAYHPVVPELPEDVFVTVIEKPISFSELDHHFQLMSNSTQATENIPEL